MKKLLSLVLAVIFVLAVFAGCGSKDSQDTKQTTPAQDNGAGGEKSSDTGNQGESSQKEELYTFKLFGLFVPAEQSESDKAFFEEIEKANNVKIELEVPPATNYEERLQIMLAGGDYPEVVLFNDHKSKIFIDSVNNGVVIPITEYVKNAPNLQKYTYDISWQAMQIKGDGDIYGMPRTSIARADGYMVRKDWLDNVGLSIPEGGAVTKEEFVNILKAFTRNDPDKNGKDDTYGFAASSGAQGEMGPILTWPFGIIGWQKYDGEYEYMDLMYSREHDNYKQALEFTRMLWQEGLIDPDWPVTKRETSIERFKQGVNGVIGEFAGWTTQYLDDMRPIQPDVELTYITGVKDDDGKVQGGSFGTGNWGLWALTTSAEKPERIIDVFDWMLSDDGWDTVKYGAEGVTYTVKDGNKVPTDEYPKYQWGRRTLRRNDDPGFFIPLNTPVDMQSKLEKWIGTCIEQAVFSKDRGFRPPAADEPEFIDYQKTFTQTISKIIVGDLPVSAYDEALEGWYKAGGEEYVKQMNEYIKKVEGE